MSTTQFMIAYFEGLTDTMEGRNQKLTRNKIKRPAGKHKSLGTQSLPKNFGKNNLVAKDELVRTCSSSYRKSCMKIDNFTKRKATFKSFDHEVEGAAISQKLQLLEIETQDIERKVGDFNDRLRSRTRLDSFDDLTETSEGASTSSLPDTETSEGASNSSLLDTKTSEHANRSTHDKKDEDSDDEFGFNSFDVTDIDNYFVETYNDNERELFISILQISQCIVTQNESSDDIQKKIHDSDYVVYKTEHVNDSSKSNKKDGEFSSKHNSFLYNRLIDGDADVADDVFYPDLPTYYRAEKHDHDSEDFLGVSKGSNFSTSHNVVHVIDNIMADDFGSKKLLERKPSRSESFTKKQKQHFIIDELIKTEEYYIEGLAKVVNNYMDYINGQTPQNLMGRTSYLFGNITHIYDNAKDFHRTLKKSGYDAAGIAQTFVDFAPRFELYPLYSKNKPTADIYLKQFDPVIKERQRQLGDKLGLSSYLLTPIQRLGKYVLLLEGLQKELKKNDQPTENISAAINVVQKVMRKGNDYIAIDSIKNSPVDLSDKGSFRMRSLFTINKPRKFESMVFLFDQIVVFTEKTTVWQGVSGVENYFQRNLEHFNYVDSIAMSDLSLGKLEERPYIFQLTNYTKAKSNHPNADFVLEAEVGKIKEEWTETIGKILWSQLELVKEQQKTQSVEPAKHGPKTKATIVTDLGKRKSYRDKKTKNSWFYDVPETA